MSETFVCITGKNCGSNSFIAVYIDQDGVRWYRSMICGNITTNQAELKAFELILRAIDPKIQNNTIVFVNNRYVFNMFEREGKTWKRTPKTNIGLIDKVRELFLGHKKMGIELAKNSESEECKKMNEFLTQLIDDAKNGVFVNE